MDTGNLLTTQDRILKIRVTRAIPPIWLVLIAGAVALLPAMIYGIPANNDLINHFRFALPFYDALQHGNLQPGWLAESNFGYGDTSFRFYPPGLYYLLTTARAITGNWYIATMSVLVVLSLAGSLGVYLWAREFLPGDLAMWASVFYCIAPYHLNQLYQAFLLAEYAGAAVLPFAFLFVARVCRRSSLSDIAGLSISYAALILTHVPLTVIGSVALFVYALTCLQKNKRWSTIFRLSTAVALGLSASSYYWVTMVAELKWIKAYDSQSVEYFQNFLFISLSPNNLNVWWMNIVLIATLAMFWPAFVLLRKWRGKEPEDRALKGVALLMFFSIFIATPLSWPLWKVISPLQQVQFPWRWLAVTSISLSVMLAAAVPFWTKLAQGRKRFLALIAAGSFAISLAFSLSHTVREAQYLNTNAFESTLRSIPGTQGVWQWWPVWVQAPFKRMTAAVDTGDRTLIVESWEPEKRVFRISAGASGEMRVRTFFYPHWTATANGASLPLRPDANGVLLMTVPADEVNVTLEFKEPSRVTLAIVLSLIGWTLIAGLMLFALRKRIWHTLHVR